MPRQIASQDPVVREAVPEKTFDDMLLTIFRVFWDGDKYQLRAKLSPYDFETDELQPLGEPYSISVRDFETQAAQSPKLTRAWEDVVDSMGLLYDFVRLKQKVEEIEATGGDASAEIIARDAALAALQAPLP
jgi:hypothetical protein